MFKGKKVIYYTCTCSC